MIKVLMLCHGNICRSPMAEFVMKQKVKEIGLDDKFEIYSKALSREEIGNGIHRGTLGIFKKYNIPYTEHYASEFERSDYIIVSLIVGKSGKDGTATCFLYDTKMTLKSLLYYLCK